MTTDVDAGIDFGTEFKYAIKSEIISKLLATTAS
jgi:hypothetical protein